MNKLVSLILVIVFYNLLLINVLGEENNVKFNIKIKESVLINDSKMYLSDFVETDNIEFYNKTKDILIGYFLYPIKERKIKGDYIKLKLKQAGIKDFDKINFPLEITAVRHYKEESDAVEKKTQITKRNITFRKNIKINSEKILLSDLIEEGDKDIIQSASQILIGYILTPGEEKVINSDMIRLKVKQSKISGLEDIGEVDSITVTREYQNLDKQMLESMIYGSIKSIYNDESYSIKVDTFENEKYVLPPGILNVEVKDQRLDGVKKGKMTVGVSIYCDGNLYKKTNANIEIAKSEKVIVLNKDASKGDILTDDIYVEKEKLFYNDMKSGYIKDITLFKGKIFKRNMKKGEMLYESDFEKRKIFKKGDIVKVLINLDGATLKTDAKALQDGFESETVNVLNEKTKKILTGNVVLDGTVIITIN